MDKCFISPFINSLLTNFYQEKTFRHKLNNDKDIDKDFFISCMKKINNACKQGFFSTIIVSEKINTQDGWFSSAQREVFNFLKNCGYDVNINIKYFDNGDKIENAFVSWEKKFID